ncbi:transposase DDE domain protein, partial [Neisseria meningitidis NM32]
MPKSPPPKPTPFPSPAKIEVDEKGQINGQTTPSKDSDARWIKKNGLYKLGYKQHTRTDAEGYIEKLHITPANAHECKHLSPLLEGVPKVRPSMPTKATTVQKTGNIWKNISCRTAL